jgi:hypothetical protein
VWQSLYEELGSLGFVPITVALDRNADEPRPFVEKAKPTHPSLLDTEHRVAELFHIVNVPTMIWIDERGVIVRPQDNQFGTDTFTQFHGKSSGIYLEQVRKWVREGKGALVADEVRKHQQTPTPEWQLARAERALAWHLHKAGRSEAAERHFVRAGELAPKDWTIRRGSMPIRGLNPFGPDFFELAKQGGAEFPMDEVSKTRVAPRATL